ncbi:formate acetyltransferase 1 [Salmonella bongori]|nr:formate acetyltransferase 1 [Salmonella bongori]
MRLSRSAVSKWLKVPAKAYNRELDPMNQKKSSLNTVKTHNQGVFDVYTPDILRCRKSGVLTGLGRMRMAVAVSSVTTVASRCTVSDYLMKDKFAQFTSLQFRSGKRCKTWKRLSVCVKKLLNSTALWVRSKKWQLNMAVDISGSGKRTPRKLYPVGLTSAIWLRLNLRTAQQCPLVAYLPSWMSTSNVT